MCDEASSSGSSPSNSGYAYFNNVLKKPEYVLAPMVEQSELPWRLQARAHGADLCFTPMIHAEVFARDNRYRCENITAVEAERPLIAQFCANKVEPFIDAIRVMAPFVDGVDLNLGCPQIIAKRGNYGAYLQDDWDIIHQMVSAAHTLVPESPISVKLRVFDDDRRTVKYAQMIEAAGAQMLTVHGRTREMRGPNTGMADWQRIALVKQSVSIPVIANGNIQEHADLQRCLQATGCDAVMSAEGQLHNPYIFESEEHPTHWSVAKEYLELCETYPTSIGSVRGHLFKMFHHSLEKYNDIRQTLAHAASMAEMNRVVGEMERRCRPLHASYLLDPKSTDTEHLSIPHWLCQPYYRDGAKYEYSGLSGSEAWSIPDKAQKMYDQGRVKETIADTTTKFAMPLSDVDKRIAAKLDARKRRADQLTALSEASGISRKLVRKFERRLKDSSIERSDDFRALSEHARQRIEDKPNKFAICSCLNPISPKCDHSLCKKCCKQDCIERKVNCTSHQFWFGDKSGLREMMTKRMKAKAANKAPE